MYLYYKSLIYINDFKYPNLPLIENVMRYFIEIIYNSTIENNSY